MTSLTPSIRSYEDLLKEQRRLKDELQNKKQQIRTDLQDLKEEFRPVLTLVSILGKLTSRETRNNALVNVGSSMTIDWLVRKFLSKNLLLRLFLPSVLKNISSHLLHKNNKSLESKVEGEKSISS